MRSNEALASIIGAKLRFRRIGVGFYFVKKGMEVSVLLIHHLPVGRGGRLALTQHLL